MRSRIVIADDHPFLLAGVCDLIEKDARFRVIGRARGAAELLQAAHAHQPDIIITDYHMPAGPDSCDGARLIEQLCRQFPQTPVVVLTMIRSPSMIEEMYRLGACAVVTKTSDPRELFAALVAARVGRIYRCADLCRAGTTVSGDTPPRRGLSPRELEVVRLFSNGDSVSDIARRLNRSRCTVSAQKSSAMRKLSVRNDQELVALGLTLVMLG